MRENLNCHCHICRVERHLFSAVEQFPGPDRFRKIATISPVLAAFTDARTLIGHLHAQKRGEYRSPSPSEVLRAIIDAGRDIGDPEMSQSVLVLAFMPTIHRTYREIRAWFQELCTEDIAQQTFLLFLELASSTATGLLGGQLSFALARSLHRNTLRWARKEQLMLFEEDRFREEQQRAAEPSEDAYFEPASLLEDFLDYCVRREIISAFERALLLKIKVDGLVAKEAADTHTVLSPKAVHMRIQRIMKKLQEAAGSNVIEMKLPNRVESMERKRRKTLSKSASNFSLSMSTGNLAIGESRRQLSLDIPPRQVTAKAQQFSTLQKDSLALFPNLISANQRKCVLRGAASRRLAAIPISDSALALRNSMKSGESLPSILRKELAGNEEITTKKDCLPLARYEGFATPLSSAPLLLAHLRISRIRSGARWWFALGERGQRVNASVHDHHRSRPLARFHCGRRVDLRFW
jgi:DNA-directed RNA polymerase specialized sigma24 family protein